MGQHLYSFRQGWQSETLAHFLLSHFAFLAQPSTIADDVGSDFYCTLFRRDRAGKNQYVIPTNSFLIQIKSNCKKLDLSDKIKFLAQLELPFFIGVANRKKMQLQIYSGRALQLIFTMIGLPAKLLVKLTPAMSDKDYYSIDDAAKIHLTVKFPLVAEVQASNIDSIASNIFDALTKENSMIYHNIASRRMGEFILKFSENDIRIFAGSGSVTKFRENFRSRLTEVFYNLEWIYKNNKQQFPKNEFKMYAEFWEKLRVTVSDDERKMTDSIYKSINGLLKKL